MIKRWIQAKHAENDRMFYINSDNVRFAELHPGNHRMTRVYFDDGPPLDIWMEAEDFVKAAETSKLLG